ncbi:alpha/beta hydrolase [Allorhizobium undicola]|uniref:alpha/beta hydrolase n=1 Tax=Allorhizobium undicola TaxID=78527 RepID=UPI0006851AFE|nr:alpha/beta hydrolase [Allorhizobium undicola]
MKTLELGISSGQPVCADLWLPEASDAAASAPAPLVVAASGGGWRRGSRSDLAQWGRFFAASGIAFASMDYRRAVSGPAFPGNVEDVAFAANALARKAPELGLDETRIALLGVSAGAHLSTLAHLSRDYDLPALRGLAAIYGPYDLVQHWQEDLRKATDRKNNLTERMMGCGPFDDPELYHRASPIRQIRADAALPVFLSWGQLDPAIDPAQSQNFAEALQQAGFQVRTRVFPDAGHFWFSEDDVCDPLTHAGRVSADLLRFFRRIFA